MPFPYIRAYRIPKELRNHPLKLARYAFKEQTMLVLSLGVFVVTSTWFGYRAYQLTAMGADTKRYKFAYTVYRDDDPRVKNIKQ